MGEWIGTVRLEGWCLSKKRVPTRHVGFRRACGWCVLHRGPSVYHKIFIILVITTKEDTKE